MLERGRKADHTAVGLGFKERGPDPERLQVPSEQSALLAQGKVIGWNACTAWRSFHGAWVLG